METKRLIFGMQGVPEGFELPKHNERAKDFAEEVEQAGNDDVELGMEVRAERKQFNDLPKGEREPVDPSKPMDETLTNAFNMLKKRFDRESHTGNSEVMEIPSARYEVEYIPASDTWRFYVTRKA